MLSRSAASLLFLLAMCLAVYSQQNAVQSDASKDPLIGRWVLNVTKSTLPPVDSWVAIEAVGDKYKVSLHFIDEHGTDFTSSTVTDMKGALSKVTKSYSTSDKKTHKQPDEEWRVTRESPSAFVVDSFFSTDRYTVSSDGKTLTNQMIDSKITTYDGPANPTPGSVKVIKTTYPVLVYDRIGEFAQTTTCEVFPAEPDAIFTVLSVRPWQAGDPLPAPDVIGLTTNDMFHKRYRLTNTTSRPLFYLTDFSMSRYPMDFSASDDHGKGFRSVFPALYGVHKSAEKDEWIRPFSGDGIHPKDENGFYAGSMYHWLELPPRATVEFENDEWHWTKFQASALFVNDKPDHRGRRELISNAVKCSPSK